MQKNSLNRSLFNYLPHALIAAMLLASSAGALAQTKKKQAVPVGASTAALTAVDDVQAELAKPFVTVNGQAVPNAQAEVLLREQLSRGVPDTPELRQGVRQMLINQTLMAQQAQAAGLTANPLVQAQMALAQQNVLTQAWQQQELNTLTIKDADLKAEYEGQVAKLGDTDYLIRHLLVKEEATAKLLLEKINAGSKVADLTRDYSQDAQTLERGGLTDWTNAAALSPALAAAVKATTKGKVASKPVQTDAGWHVLQVEDSRPAKFATLEEAKPQLTSLLVRRQSDERLKALQAQARIE
jgi:peptidyl-prolyl cis-trans isomerase C